VRRTAWAAPAAILVIGTLAGCGSSATTQVGCAAGPRPPGVRANLTAEQPFAASDINNLSRRFYTAGATCVSVGSPGGTTVELSEQGITGARAQLLLKAGRLTFATWSRRPEAGGAAPSPQVALDPAQVATVDGGSCAGSTASLECAPAGYVALETGVDGNAVSSAAAATDPNSGQPEVQLTLTEQGTSTLGQVTSRLPSQPPPLNQLAIVLDGTMLSNANVNAPLNNGTVRISGGLLTSRKGLAADLATLVSTGRVTPYQVTSQSNL